MVLIVVLVDICAAVVILYTNSTSLDSKYTILFLFALICLSVRCCLGNGGPCWSICKACMRVILYILFVVVRLWRVLGEVLLIMCNANAILHVFSCYVYIATIGIVGATTGANGSGTAGGDSDVESGACKASSVVVDECDGCVVGFFFFTQL